MSRNSRSHGVFHALGCALLFAAGLSAQSPQITVTRPTRFAVSPRLPDLPDVAQAEFDDHEPLALPPRPSPPSQGDRALQAQGGQPARAITRNNFDGIGSSGSAPPDTNIAVGPNHIVEVVNSRYQIFSKAGGNLLGPKSLSSLWTPLGGSCATANAGDPVVQYDRLADRWMITQLGSLRSPYSQCIAVSTSPDPQGTYNLYSYNYSTNLNDYPKFGVWPTATNGAYTATYNLFASGRTFAGGQMCAYDRTAMLGGSASPASVCYTITNDAGFLPADLDGTTPPADGTPAYFLTWETTASLRVYKLAPNFANTALSTLTQMPDLAVGGFVQACSSCVPQAGTTQTLDTLSDRVMYRLAYRIFGDHASMVVNHTVTSGPGSTTGVRWYELRAPLTANAAFSVYQQSTFAPDATYRWMGSAAMDKVGNIAIGYSASSSSLNPALRYTGRYETDPLNTMQDEISILVGTGSQTTGLSRWGDYAALRIDPSDDCTFWFSSEYEKTSGTFNWVTHVGSFSFPNCGTSTPTPDFTMSANPTTATVVQGNSTGSTITLTAVNGFSQSVNLSVGGCPAGATCSVAPNPVTPNGTSALSIAAGTATPGSYTLTVQGTAGTLTHSTTVGLTVQSAADFSISANPTSVTVVQGSGGNSTVTLTALNGYNKPVTVTVSGCPAGATCSMGTSPVTPTGTSTLNIATTTATPGSYSLTVQGTDGTLTHTTPVTLTVQAKPDFSISANPTTLTIPSGGNGSSTITLTSLNGYNKTVTLSVLSGCPTGATCALNPTSVTPNGTSTLSISGGNVSGSYTVNIQGTDGTLTRTTTVGVTVQVVADFSISVSPTSLSFKKGNSGSTTVTIVQTGGNAPVALSVTGLPANVTAAFSPASVANGTSTLTVSAKGNAARGTFNLSVSGSNALGTHTVPLSLNIQ